MKKAYVEISVLVVLFALFVAYGVVSAPNAAELGLFLAFVAPIVGGIFIAWGACIYKDAKKHQEYIEKEAEKQAEIEENYRSGKWAIDVDVIIVDVEYDVDDNSAVVDGGYVYTVALAVVHS